MLEQGLRTESVWAARTQFLNDVAEKLAPHTAVTDEQLADLCRQALPERWDGLRRRTATFRQHSFKLLVISPFHQRITGLNVNPAPIILRVYINYNGHVNPLIVRGCYGTEMRRQDQFLQASQIP